MWGQNLQFFCQMAVHSMKGIKELPTTKERKLLQWFQFYLVLDLPFKKGCSGVSLSIWPLLNKQPCAKCSISCYVWKVTHIFNIMLKILRPILMTFFTTTAVKRLVVDLLRSICKQTTNTLDDRAVDILEKQLFPDKWTLKNFST